MASFGQVFIGMSATTKGAGVQLGYLSTDGIEISTGYKVPLISATNPSVFNLSLGKQILLTHDDEDNYSITPSAGIASVSYKVIDKDVVTKVSKITAIYGIEIGKDAYLGRVFIAANYAQQFYFSIGIKAFIK